jgi:hypothetical protein
MAGLGARLGFATTSQGVRRCPRSSRIVAEVLQANNAMLNLAKRLGKIEIRSEEGSYYVTLLFA